MITHLGRVVVAHKGDVNPLENMATILLIQFLIQRKPTDRSQTRQTYKIRKQTRQTFPGKARQTFTKPGQTFIKPREQTDRLTDSTDFYKCPSITSLPRRLISNFQFVKRQE